LGAKVKMTLKLRRWVASLRHAYASLLSYGFELRNSG
jgi:hypothetical protein